MPRNTKYAEGPHPAVARPAGRRQSVHAHHRARAAHSASASRTSPRPSTESPRWKKFARKRPTSFILDWEMPLLNGAELVRIVRSPGVFPTPDIPIIMLTAPWRALAHSRIGQDRRERVSLQAGVGQGAVRPTGLDCAQAARQRASRQILRPGAANPGGRPARVGVAGSPTLARVGAVLRRKHTFSPSRALGEEAANRGLASCSRRVGNYDEQLGRNRLAADSHGAVLMVEFDASEDDQHRFVQLDLA